MGILKIFSGKEPEEYEKRGDTLFETKQYGLAKIEYETGLGKLEKRGPADTNLEMRFREKILQSKEALALQHQQTGEELIAAEMYEDAEELLRVALDLTENPELTREIEHRLRELDQYSNQEGIGKFSGIAFHREDPETDRNQEPGDDYFTVLCGSLPEEMLKAYHGYGDAFRAGYIALNQGDFERAVAKLSQAVEENPAPKSFIPLELATAYLNLGHYEKARTLLEAFVREHRESLHGYSLLCEVFWELKEFDRAQKLLLSCPQELTDSLPVHLLRGETFFQAQDYQEAKSLYLDYLRSFGWDETIARSLAKTYEALGEREKARDLYGEIMMECRGCRVRIDPLVKQRYADLCFDLGEYSIAILELYLSLVQEDPDRKVHYYQKISRIYSAQGNEQEARRYQLFAARVKGDSPQKES
jgi:tetratricopeptide (TPR) repeat protein